MFGDCFFSFLYALYTISFQYALYTILLFFDYSHFCPMRGVPQTPTLRIPLKLQPKPRVLGFFDISRYIHVLYTYKVWRTLKDTFDPHPIPSIHP